MIIDVTPRPRVIRAWADGSKVPAYILELHSSHSHSSVHRRQSPDVDVDVRVCAQEAHPSTARRDRHCDSADPDSRNACRGAKEHVPSTGAALAPDIPAIPEAGPSGSHSHCDTARTARTSHAPQAESSRTRPPHSHSQNAPRPSLRDPSYSPSAPLSPPRSPHPPRTGYSLRTGRPPSLPLSPEPSLLEVVYDPVDPQGRIAQALLSSPSGSSSASSLTGILVPGPAPAPGTPRSRSSRVSWNLGPPAKQAEKEMSKLRTAPPGVAPTLHPSVTAYRQQLTKTKGLVSEIAFGEATDRELRLKIHKAFSAVEPFAVLDPEYTAVLQSLEYESLKHLSEDLERLIVRWHPVSSTGLKHL